MKLAPVVETYDRIVREVKSDLVIVGAGEFVGGNKTPVVVKAIWDTGAYGSVISPKVAGELGLTPATKFIFRIPAEGDTPLVAEG